MHFKNEMKFDRFLGGSFFGEESSDELSGARKKTYLAECAGPGEPSGGVNWNLRIIL